MSKYKPNVLVTWREIENYIKNDKNLKKVPNCILGSHNAFNTVDETERVNKKTLQNLIKYL